MSNQLPDIFLAPLRLDANCEVSELPNGEGCLRAIRAIKAGDFLAVLPSDSEEDEEDEDEHGEDDCDDEDEVDEEDQEKE